MKMSKVIRCCAFVVISLLLTMCVKGDGECDQLLQGTEHNNLAQSTLRNVFASFHQIFNTVYSSDSIQRNLDEKTMRFAELLIAAKRIELELKELDDKKLNHTIEELCRGSTANDLWLKCTNVVLRTEFELQNLLRDAINEPEIHYRPQPAELNYRPRTG